MVHMRTSRLEPVSRGATGTTAGSRAPDGFPVPALTLDPVPPFVWPDPRVFGGSHAYTSAVPYDSVISWARGLAGVVSGVDLQGARWLAALVRIRNLQSRLVIVLYPACPTRAEGLDAAFSPVDRSRTDWPCSRIGTGGT